MNIEDVAHLKRKIIGAADEAENGFATLVKEIAELEEKKQCLSDELKRMEATLNLAMNLKGVRAAYDRESKDLHALREGYRELRENTNKLEGDHAAARQRFADFMGKATEIIR